MFILRTPATIKFFHQILKNFHFGVKKKSLPTQMDLYDPYIVPHTIPLGYFNFPRSTNKLNFLTKFRHLEKIVNLMKDLKYENQSIFPMWGKVKISFRDRYGKPNICSKNSSHYQYFHQNLKR